LPTPPPASARPTYQAIEAQSIGRIAMGHQRREGSLSSERGAKVAAGRDDGGTFVHLCTSAAQFSEMKQRRVRRGGPTPVPYLFIWHQVPTIWHQGPDAMRTCACTAYRCMCDFHARLFLASIKKI
jgi:hypothetical protein